VHAFTITKKGKEGGARNHSTNNSYKQDKNTA